MFWLTPSRLQLWPDTSNPEDGRLPAIGPIPLRSIGPMAGIVGLLCVYREEVALARLIMCFIDILLILN